MIDDSYTVSLLHFDGADAGTVFTDESGKAWTTYGNAQIDTAQYVFGGASGLFDGTLDRISTPDHADFNFAGGDFTIDGWARSNNIGTPTNQILVAQWGGTIQRNWLVESDYSSGTVTVLNFYWSYNGTSLISKIIGTIFSNTWFHFAAMRSGTALYTSLNGTITAGTNIAGSILYDSTQVIDVGGFTQNTALGFNGWLDEVRISKGIARWTSNFTPPITAYGMGGYQAIWFS
jgi:hypothetical protein